MNTVMYAILQGDFRRAFVANKGVILISPILIPLLMVYLFNWLKDKRVNVDKVTNLVVIYFIIWTLLRNLI